MMVRRLLLASLVWASVVMAGGEVAVPPVTRVTLDNGLRVIVAEYHELPLVEMHVMVGAGAAQDPRGKDGLAALVATTIDRGAGSRSAEALAQAIESLGGRIGPTPGTDATTITAEFLRDDFAAGLGLLRDILMHPTFARDEVRRSREQQLAGLLAERDEAEAIADRCFAAALHGAHPYGGSPEGTIATVSGLDRGDVRGFYDRFYRPNNTIVAIVGDVAADDAIARVREAFGSWRPREDAVPERVLLSSRSDGLRVFVVDKPDATQTQIRAGNVAFDRRAPEYVPAQVASAILGGGFSSRLIAELRVKRSLTYGAGSHFVPRLTGGDFRLSTFTKSATTGETLRLLFDVVEAFRRDGATTAELAKVKTYLAGQFPLKLETPNAVAARLAEMAFFSLPDDELATYRGRIAAVTATDVSRIAKTFMRAREAGVIVVVGKAAEIQSQVEQVFGPVQVTKPETCDSMHDIRK